jgi:hypothetical protein
LEAARLDGGFMGDGRRDARCGCRRYKVVAAVGRCENLREPTTDAERTLQDKTANFSTLPPETARSASNSSPMFDLFLDLISMSAE